MQRSPTLSAELSTKLQQLQQIDLSKAAQQVLQRSNKTQRQESYKRALLELNISFEEHLAEAIGLRFNLHAGQQKKLQFKKDRIRLLKQHGIDYLAIDGVQTAQVLLWIAQSIVYEDALVTENLHDVFAFWKQGYPMVQLDNAYDTLAEDIQIHYQALIDALLQA